MPIDAEKFYATTPSPAAAAAPEPSTIVTAAAASGESAESPPESAADQFYGGEREATSTYLPRLRNQLDVLARHAGVGPEQQAEMGANAAVLFSDAGLNVDEADEVYTMFVTHARTPADDATRNAWQAESLRQLNETYGASANARLAVAKQFIAERPELVQLLASTGLGSHPRVVSLLVANSHKLRLRGAKK